MNDKIPQLIVIDGIDGSGKATQSDLLAKKMKRIGADVVKLSFPDYDSQSSSLVKMYLDGTFGSSPNSVNAYAASLFYSVDRYASYKAKWESDYNAGKTIIADRYTTANLIHQCTKLPKSQWEDFRKWLAYTEYTLMGIPAPDIVFYLNCPVEACEQLICNRYHGDFSKKDIHEANKEYLIESCKAAHYWAKRTNWVNIDCTKYDDATNTYKMRKVDDINNDIMDALSKRQIKAIGKMIDASIHKYRFEKE